MRVCVVGFRFVRRTTKMDRVNRSIKSKGILCVRGARIEAKRICFKRTHFPFSKCNFFPL